MQPRDSVSTSFLRRGVLYVFGVTPEDDGTVLVSLADVDLDERFDVEVRLFALEHPWTCRSQGASVLCTHFATSGCWSYVRAVPARTRFSM
jgi:hypothetical protein